MVTGGQGLASVQDADPTSGGRTRGRAPGLPRPLTLGRHQHGGRLVLAQNQEGVADLEDGFTIKALGGAATHSPFSFCTAVVF